MLDTLRRSSKGWLGGLLILVLVGSFGFLFGIQDWMDFTPTTKIATVGGENITPETFQQEFARYLKRASRETKVELSTAEAKAKDLDRIALDEMLTRYAIVGKAKAFGLTVTNNQVGDILRANIPDGSGGVNRNQLQQLLQDNQVSEPQFYELVRSDLLRSQLVRTVTGGVTLPPGMEAALHRFRRQRLVAEYVLIDPARAGQINDPADAALKTYYDTHADKRYSTPEYRGFTFVTIRNEDVASRVTVTDDEIRKAYDRAKNYFETPEKRKIEQIRFKTEAAARTAKSKLDAGQTFEAVAIAEGFKPEDIKLGEVSKTDTTIPAAAFDLPVNKVSDPLKGAFGWVILRVLAVTPGTVKTFEAVRGEIRDQFVKERSKDMLVGLTIDFEEALGGGATIEEAAKKFNLAAKSIPTVDLRGNDPAGAPVQGLPGGDFLTQVFATETGVDSDVGETGDGVRYLYRVDKVTPVARKPLAQVREEVLTNWRNEELAKRLTGIADDLVKKGNGGQSIASISSSFGVAPLKTDPMPRYGVQAVFGPDAMEAAGEAKIGQFFTGSVIDGKSRVVAKLTEITYEDEAPTDPLRAAYSANLRQVFAEDLVEQFNNAIRADVGVSIDETQFAKFHTGE
ncbi:MAG: peptidyl-prolyl cis-trans isomerase [Micropepsaceae bacterium]